MPLYPFLYENASGIFIFYAVALEGIMLFFYIW